MQVILLQKVRNLGDIGDEVKVRAGYGRNFLIPNGVALMATKSNRSVFEQRKAELLAASEQREARARGRAETVMRTITVPMRASDEGRLYGSVSPQEIADALTAEGHEMDPSEVILAEGAIRQTGYYTATLSLHPEVEVEIELIVAQLTDMGVNMPPEPASAEDEAAQSAVDEQGEGPAAEDDEFEAEPDNDDEAEIEQPR